MAQVIDNEGIVPGGAKYDIEYDTQNLNSKKKFEPSICSKLCIAWPSRYIIKGYYNSLKAEDMPPLFDSHKTRSTLPKAFKAWDAQVDTWKKDKKNAPRPSVQKLILGQLSWTFYVGAIFGFFAGILNCAGRPILLKLVIQCFMPNSIYSEQDMIYILIFFAFAVIGEGFCKTQAVNLISTESGTQTLSYIFSLIERKTAATSNARPSNAEKEREKQRQMKKVHGYQNAPTGGRSSEANLVGNDCLQTYDNMRFAAYSPSNVSGLVAGIVALFYILGPIPALIGISVLTVCLILNRILSKFAGYAADRDLKAADSRLTVMREVIESIGPVKFMCWEQPYLDTLKKKRDEEVTHIMCYRLLNIISLTIARTSPILATCCTFTYVALQGLPMTPDIVFSALAAYMSLRLPLIGIPNMFIQYQVVNISCDRIGDYLLRPDFTPLPEKTDLKGSGKDDFVVDFQNAYLSWNPIDDSVDGKDNKIATKESTAKDVELCIIRDLTLQVKAGDLIGVCGRVGCGKSTLLNSLLGETYIIKGTGAANRDIGYVPQRPFVLSGTILENITMGRPFNAMQVDEAIKAAAFDTDLASMPAGLKTEIGERGTTLSGGQKQRLAIARAIYTNPTILYMDDALAAVDGKVASIQFLPECDKIVFLRTDEPALIGRFDHLEDINAEFKEMVKRAAEGVDADIDSLEVGKTEVEEEGGAKFEKNNDVDIEDGKGKDGDGKKLEEEIEGEKEQYDTSGKLFTKEVVKKGGHNASVLSKYLKAAGGYPLIGLYLLIMLSTYTCFCLTDIWLAGWVSVNNTLSLETRLVGYICFSVGQALLMGIASTQEAYMAKRASSNVHEMLLHRLLHAPSSWFEATPSGEIISRFSGDLATMDKMFPLFLDHLCHMFMNIFALSITISIIIPTLIPVLFVGLFVYQFQIDAVDRSNRMAKRQTIAALSPIMTTLIETANGRTVIHAMNFQSFFCKKQYKNIDRWSNFNHFSSSTFNWGIWMTQILAVFFSIGAVVLIAVQKENYTDVALIGVALNYSFLLPYFLAFFSQNSMMVRMFFTAVERLMKYDESSMPQEPEWVLKTDPKKGTWPTNGTLKFKNVEMAYREGLPPAIRDVNVNIDSGKHIGIVGRTGAGKTSFIVVLFRIVDCQKGSVKLDGKELDKLGLHTVRRALAIIPQTPLLIPGTLAHNLDPFDKYSENKLIEVVEKVGLKANGLKEKASELSVGQQQLMALARLLLREGSDRPKVIVMDEPTANIDAQTDEILQKVINEEFKGITMLTIAHRLNTVIGSDAMMVMDSGLVKEYDSAHNLLQKDNSLLATMVDALGNGVSNSLRSLAKEAADETKRV